MYETLKEAFCGRFSREAEYIFSAPGRTELSGNHTDHQHGCVLAAAVTLDTRAAVAKTRTDAFASSLRATPFARSRWTI